MQTRTRVRACTTSYKRGKEEELTDKRRWKMNLDAISISPFAEKQMLERKSEALEEQIVSLKDQMMMRDSQITTRDAQIQSLKSELETTRLDILQYQVP